MRRSLPEKCSVIACRVLGTHVLAYRNPIYGSQVPADFPVVVREPVCEECGTELVNTNWVKRAGGVLARNGAVVSVVPPRIRVRVQDDSDPDAYAVDSGWWEDKDVAAMQAGYRAPLVVEIIDGAGRVLDACPNLIGPPKLPGIYARPEDIPDPWVQYYAADHWTPCFGIKPGDLAVRHGRTVVVLAFEQVDQDYGYDTGYNTGYMVVKPAGESAVHTAHITELGKVREITA